MIDKPSNPKIGSIVNDDGKIFVYIGNGWEPVISISTTTAKNILDFFDNGNHDIYNKKQWKAFKELRKLLDT